MSEEIIQIVPGSSAGLEEHTLNVPMVPHARVQYGDTIVTSTGSGFDIQSPVGFDEKLGTTHVDGDFAIGQDVNTEKGSIRETVVFQRVQ